MFNLYFPGIINGYSFLYNSTSPANISILSINPSLFDADLLKSGHPNVSSSQI